MPVSVHRRAIIAIERCLDEIDKLDAESGVTVSEHSYLRHCRVLLSRLVRNPQPQPAPPPPTTRQPNLDGIGDVIREARRRVR